MNFRLVCGKTSVRPALIVLGILCTACSGPASVRVEQTTAAELQEPAGEPAESAVVPVPAFVSMATGARFIISPSTEIHFPSGNVDVAWTAHYLAKLIPVQGDDRPLSAVGSGVIRAGAINLVLDASMDTVGDEGYRLVITSGGIVASAPRPAGLFYAVQTLRQMLPPRVELGAPLGRQAVNGATIVDEPRFAWRGAMLDVSRHFLSPPDVKRYIDLMALYKLNRLHLHLSDDQGWRIEIKSWPNLTTHGGSTAVGGGAGGFYTQAAYSDIVEYARRRFITVVPEIDMPGHTNAALASYPELNCDGRARPLYTGIRVGFSSLCTSSEATYRFVDDVVREISAITPRPWFHIGGDEGRSATANTPRSSSAFNRSCSPTGRR